MLPSKFPIMSCRHASAPANAVKTDSAIVWSLSKPSDNLLHLAELLQSRLGFWNSSSQALDFQQ